MPKTARYLTHPQVQIDPAIPVPRWSLSAVGAARVANVAAQLGLLKGTRRVISSGETKALETANPIAASLGVAVEVRPLTHENDRSATGFLPPLEFERVADQFFANPKESVRGWEPAEDAQRRIVSEVDACLIDDLDGDILFVGHGGVGTLLFCALSDNRIDRRFDQGPGVGGCWFEFDPDRRRAIGGWRPMEALIDGCFDV